MTGAGDLDRRIVIERKQVIGDDGFGNQIYDWAPVATVSASRFDVSDKERAAYGTVISELISRFVIRNAGAARTVNAVDRLQHKGGIWDIMGVKESRQGRNHFLEITAKLEG